MNSNRSSITEAQLIKNDNETLNDQFNQIHWFGEIQNLTKLMLVNDYDTIYDPFGCDDGRCNYTETFPQEDNYSLSLDTNGKRDGHKLKAGGTARVFAVPPFV